MENINNLDPVLYTVLRKGSGEDPYIHKIEKQQIQNGKALLSEIPQFQERVIVKSEDDDLWYEIDDGIPNENQYLVDYNTGIILFHESNEAKTLKFDYTGIGVVYVNASRAYTSISLDGSVTETIQSLINNNRIYGNVSHKLPPVQTFEDIATTYPFPIKGDMVEVLTGEYANRMFIWTGKEWEWFLTFPFDQVEQNRQDIAGLASDFNDFKNETNNNFNEKQEKLNDIAINVKNFLNGLKLDGKDDVTHSIINAITYAQSNHIRNVYCPDGFYRTTQKITIPYNIHLFGSGGITSIKWEPSSTLVSDLGKDGGRPSPYLSGTWIFYDGALDDNVFMLQEGSFIENFGFYYIGNSWDKWTLKEETFPYGLNYPLHQPKMYAPTIIPDMGHEFRVKSLFFINAYEAIRVDNTENVNIEDIKINNIHMGINIIKASAHLSLKTINIYPYWARPYGWLGDSMRPNLYSSVYGTGIKIGDSSNGTLEQTLLQDISVFDTADGIILGGKGVQAVNIKVDNTFRPMTITSNNSSSLHNLSNIWLSSFTEKASPIADGTLYALKIDTGGSIQINNLAIAAADGYGILATQSDWLLTMKDINISNCRYKGLVLGDNTSPIYRASINGIIVNCANKDVIPYEIHNPIMSYFNDFKITGDPTTPIIMEVLNNTNSINLSNLGNGARNEFNGISTFNGKIIAASPSVDPSDTNAPIQLHLIKNRNGVNPAEGVFSVTNYNETGNSSSRLGIGLRRASSDIIDYMVWLNNQDATLTPENDGLMLLGSNTNKWKELHANSAILDRLKLNLISSSQAENFELFIDIDDGGLKWKDGSGSIRQLINPNE